MTTAGYSGRARAGRGMRAGSQLLAVERDQRDGKKKRRK